MSLQISVTPVRGQPLCFRVGSRTQPGVEYFVNWVEHYCTCPAFHKQSEIYLQSTGSKMVCWHMGEAMKVGWNCYVETAREIQLAQ